MWAFPEVDPALSPVGLALLHLVGEVASAAQTVDCCAVVFSLAMLGKTYPPHLIQTGIRACSAPPVTTGLGWPILVNMPLGSHRFISANMFLAYAAEITTNPQLQTAGTREVKLAPVISMYFSFCKQSEFTNAPTPNTLTTVTSETTLTCTPPLAHSHFSGL